MMKRFFLLLLCACVVSPLASCGHKGKLKTPSQIEKDEAKKAKKEAKRARQLEEESQKE